MVKCGVLFEVRTVFLYIIERIFGFKGLKILIPSAIFLKKQGSGTHSGPKFCRRGEGVSLIDSRIKAPERRSGLRPFQ
jgi:hypothetical protein